MGAGCGGFIDISQTAKKVVFVGTFTSGGLQARGGRWGCASLAPPSPSAAAASPPPPPPQVAVLDGKLAILREGRSRKFTGAVHEKTFAGSSGARACALLALAARLARALAHSRLPTCPPTHTQLAGGRCCTSQSGRCSAWSSPGARRAARHRWS